MKLRGAGVFDMGCCEVQGPFVGYMMFKDNWRTKNVSAVYTVNADFKCAATFQDSGEASRSFALAGVYKNLYKFKIAHDQTVSVSAKHSLAKGFNLLGGASYSAKKGTHSFGWQLSIE